MKYHFMSLQTGELQKNVFGVIKVIIEDFRLFKTFNIRWSYSKAGF